MLFHAFNSQEERRNFGGSAFIELQFCKMPPETKIKKIVASNSINNWQNDSLFIYMDDQNTFWQKYSNIFDCGIYNNLNSGIVDIYGINYYAPALIDSIIKKLQESQPLEYNVLIDWLIKAKSYNGFYILGI